MNAKPVLIVLAALLLVQCSLGKPTPENISKESSEESKENDTPAGSSSLESKEVTVMTNLITAELSELADFSFMAAKKLLTDVLGDLKTIEDKSDAIKTKIEEFSKVAAEVDKIDPSNRDQLGNKLVLLIDMLDTNTTETDKLSEEDSFVQNSLKTHGIEATAKEFEQKFLVICEKFYKAANNYLNSLNSEELKKKEMLREWLKQFEEETTAEKKMEMFRHMFYMKD